MFRFNQFGGRERSSRLSIVNMGPATHPQPLSISLSLPPYLVSSIAFLRESQFRMSLFPFGLIRIGRTAEEEAKKAAMLITSPPPLTDLPDEAFTAVSASALRPVMHPLSFGRQYSGGPSIR